MRASVTRMIHPALPFGSSEWRVPRARPVGYAKRVLLEIGVILLTIVGFVLLDLYVVGCEKV